MALQRERREQGSTSRWAAVTRTVTVAVLLAAGNVACNTPTDEKLPPTVADPASLKTPSGAMARYRGAVAGLPAVFDSLLTLTGVLTDELVALPTPMGVSSAYTAIDSRQDLSGIGLYNGLHHLRGQAQEARGFVQAYAPDSSGALAGHLYALEAYADVFLADVFCSGIPLSTVDFDGNYTLMPGSTTTAVYERAVVLFDSALVLASDSVRIQQFAAVGKGRALVALGRYAEAAAAVVSVPDDYQYQVQYSDQMLEDFVQSGDGYYANLPALPSVANYEGTNGLDYRASGDPRTAATAMPGTDPNGNTYWFPNKYPFDLYGTPTATLTIADGVEARLIEAEAALQAGDATTWLAKLNAPRSASGLPALTDPGTPDGRIALLFRERAFWFYLTGHRQGDLRRLVRNYVRDPATLYPTGPYFGGSGAYGQQIVAPVPTSERELNPNYTGCVHLGA